MTKKKVLLCAAAFGGTVGIASAVWPALQPLSAEALAPREAVEQSDYSEAPAQRETVEQSDYTETLTQRDAIEQSVHYEGCNEVRRLGKAPLYRGQPGYGEHMDGDNDGIACEPHY